MARGSYAKGRAKRAQILEAALDLIAREGYSKTTIRQLADAVDLTPNGVLHYFGSKEALLAAVVEARDSIDRSGVDEEADARSAVDAFPEFLASSADIPGLIQLFARLSNEATDTEHDAHEYFSGRYERGREFWIRIFEARAQAGLLRGDVDPATAATMFIALSDGLQTQWLYDDSIDMPAAARAFLTLLAPDDLSSRG